MSDCKMSKEYTYKDYVKKGLWSEFKRMCEKNSLDFYGCGCVLTAHLVLKNLMGHTFKGTWKQIKVSPKDAWNSAMEQTDYHSGASVGMTVSIIFYFSPRGKEFKKWWKKNE